MRPSRTALLAPVIIALAGCGGSSSGTGSVGRAAAARRAAGAHRMTQIARPGEDVAPPTVVPEMAEAPAATTRPAVVSGLSDEDALYEAAFRFLLNNRRIDDDCVLVLTDNNAPVAIPRRVTRSLALTGAPFMTYDEVNAPDGDLPADFASDQPGHHMTIAHVGILGRLNNGDLQVELSLIRGNTGSSQGAGFIAHQEENGTWSFARIGN